MRKSLTLLLLLSLATVSLRAQFYTVDSWVEPYENLASSNLINPNDPDEWIVDVTLNFNFSAFGESYSNKFIADGGIAFANGSQTKINGILAYWDWVLRPDTKISYQLSGTAGSKILKVEFRNVGFYEESADLGSQEDYMNFQIWLYEGSNKAQFRFGPSSTEVLSSAGNALESNIGIFQSTQTATVGNFLQGSEEVPFIVVDNTEDYSFFSGLPSEGRVFEFCPLTVCLSSTEDMSLPADLIYPNPARDHFSLDLESIRGGRADLKILHASGYVAAVYPQYEDEQIIDISGLPAGVYQLLIEYEGGHKYLQLVKMDTGH